MLISLVAAIGPNREIGRGNRLLWHISDDLKNFKALTLGHHLLMGRKTWSSIGRPLPGRVNLVLSQQAAFTCPGAVCLRSWQEAFRVAQAAGESELFVIGGGHVYEQILPFAHRLYLSRVAYTGEADTYFPPFEQLPWQETLRQNHAAGNDGTPAWSYHVLSREPSDWQKV